MGIRIKLGPERAKLLKQQIAADVEVLRQHNIMDYSLLLGIHYEDRPVPARRFRGSGTFRAPTISSLNRTAGNPNIMRSASARAVLSSGGGGLVSAVEGNVGGTLTVAPAAATGAVEGSVAADDEHSVTARAESKGGEGDEDG